MNPQWPYSFSNTPITYQPQPLPQTSWNVQDNNIATLSVNTPVSSPLSRRIPIDENNVFPFHVPPPNIVSTQVPPPTFCSDFVPQNYPTTVSHSLHLTVPLSTLTDAASPPLPSSSPPPLPSTTPPPLPSTSPPPLPLGSPPPLPIDSPLPPIPSESPPISDMSPTCVLNDSSSPAESPLHSKSQTPVITESAPSWVETQIPLSIELQLLNPKKSISSHSTLTSTSTVSVPITSVEFSSLVSTKSLTLPTVTGSSPVPSKLLSEQARSCVSIDSFVAPDVSDSFVSANSSPVVIQPTSSVLNSSVPAILSPLIVPESIFSESELVPISLSSQPTPPIQSNLHSVHIQLNHTHILSTADNETNSAFNSSIVKQSTASSASKAAEQFVSKPASSPTFIQIEESAPICLAEAVVIQPLSPAVEIVSPNESAQNTCPNEDQQQLLSFVQQQVLQEHNYSCLEIMNECNFEGSCLAAVIAKDHDYCSPVKELNHQSIVEEPLSENSETHQQSASSRTSCQVQLDFSFAMQPSQNLSSPIHKKDVNSYNEICNSDYKNDETTQSHKIQESEKNDSNSNTEIKYVNSPSETCSIMQSHAKNFESGELCKNLSVANQEISDDSSKTIESSELFVDKIDKPGSIEVTPVKNSDSELDIFHTKSLSKTLPINECTILKDNSDNKHIQNLSSETHENQKDKIEHLNKVGKLASKVKENHTSKVPDPYENINVKSKNCQEQNSTFKNDNNHVDSCKSIFDSLSDEDEGNIKTTDLFRRGNNSDSNKNIDLNADCHKEYHLSVSDPLSNKERTDMKIVDLLKNSNNSDSNKNSDADCHKEHHLDVSNGSDTYDLLSKGDETVIQMANLFKSNNNSNKNTDLKNDCCREHYLNVSSANYESDFGLTNSDAGNNDKFDQNNKATENKHESCVTELDVEKDNLNTEIPDSNKYLSTKNDSNEGCNKNIISVVENEYNYSDGEINETDYSQNGTEQDHKMVEGMEETEDSCSKLNDKHRKSKLTYFDSFTNLKNNKYEEYTLNLSSKNDSRATMHETDENYKTTKPLKIETYDSKLKDSHRKSHTKMSASDKHMHFKKHDRYKNHKNNFITENEKIGKNYDLVSSPEKIVKNHESVEYIKEIEIPRRKHKKSRKDALNFHKEVNYKEEKVNKILDCDNILKKRQHRKSIHSSKKRHRSHSSDAEKKLEHSYSGMSHKKRKHIHSVEKHRVRKKDHSIESHKKEHGRSIESRETKEISQFHFSHKRKEHNHLVKSPRKKEKNYSNKSPRKKESHLVVENPIKRERNNLFRSSSEKEHPTGSFRKKSSHSFRSPSKKESQSLESPQKSKSSSSLDLSKSPKRQQSSSRRHSPHSKKATIDQEDRSLKNTKNYDHCAMIEQDDRSLKNAKNHNHHVRSSKSVKNSHIHHAQSPVAIKNHTRHHSRSPESLKSSYSHQGRSPKSIKRLHSRSDRSAANKKGTNMHVESRKTKLSNITRNDSFKSKIKHNKENQRMRRRRARRRSSTPKDLPCLSLKTYKYVCSTAADDYYYSEEQDAKEVFAKDALKTLHEKFKYELVERAERIRASKPKYDPPKRKTKLRKPKPPKTESNSESSSSSSEKSSSEEEDTAIVELERKKKHPYRLHLELWFNDPKEMNDGPLCRCSAKARRAGIRHGIYVGEDHLPLCDPFSNNSNRLFHYRITMTPHTNFLTKNPTTIFHNGHDYRFEGFSMFAHSKLPQLPNCKVIRFNYEYTIVYAEEEFPKNFTVQGLELYSKYLLIEILELVDLNWKAHNDPDGCPRFHLMPRFARELKDGGKELLSHCYVLQYLLNRNQILVNEKKLSDVLSLSNGKWQDLADEVKGMIVTCPGMKPSSIRVDQLDREQCSPGKEEFPVIVHFGVRPPQLSYAGNPHYQKAWRDYVKYRHLLANKPKVKYYDRHKLLQKEMRLQEMRMENDLKRDVTVVISSKNFYKTGIMSDIIQHAMLLPVLICHLRFHQSLTYLEKKLGYQFQDRFLLQLALTHPSYRENFGTNPDHARNSLTNCGLRQPQYGDRRIHYMNTRKRGINTLINIMSRFGSRKETASNINHNERLEFLGDAVVEFLSSIHLFYMFPDLEEGGLATYRAAIVQNQHLAVLSKKLELDRFMLYAHGSDLCHDLELRHAMANCFEALMGALFLDNGIEVADKVFSKTLFSELELLEVWMNFSPHPLQEQEPEGDRKWIQSVPLLLKLHEFEQTIGIEFNHIRLLARALTHRSLGYNNLTLGSNQRLEFLGDTVLQLVASEYLYKFFPEHHEGHLSLLRSSLVNNRTQAVVCADLGMVDYAIYPDNKVELKPKDKADLLEAFLGALYVDKDLGYCRKFCEVCFFPRLQDFIMNQDWNDPKSKLQQCCLTLRSMDGGEPDIPTYKVIECKGPTNTRVYSVAVYFQGSRLAVGSGHSIQQAEMDAAGNALRMSKNLFPQLRHQRRAIERSLKKRPAHKSRPVHKRLPKVNT